jgi:hypothetical protein
MLSFSGSNPSEIFLPSFNLNYIHPLNPSSFRGNHLAKAISFLDVE